MVNTDDGTGLFVGSRWSRPAFLFWAASGVCGLATVVALSMYLRSVDMRPPPAECIRSRKQSQPLTNSDPGDGIGLEGGWAGPSTRVGDPGAVFDPAKYEDKFPKAKEWAKAGVRGGIPLRVTLPVVAKLHPGDDIQAALDAASKDGGVVLLTAGTYPLLDTLKLPNSVVLRGVDCDQVILWNGRPDAGVRSFRTIFVCSVKWAGIEDLSVCHPPKPKGAPKTHHGHTGITIGTCEDCWIDGCKFLCSSEYPVAIVNSKHVTLRGNVVSGRFKDGHYTAGVYELSDNQYLLVCNETIVDAEHLEIDGNKNCVLIIEFRTSKVTRMPIYAI